MKLSKILHVLKNEPMLCSDSYRTTLLDIFQQHAELSATEYRATRTGKAESGSLLEVEQMEVEDGVARIPVGGPIGIGLGEFEKGAGAVDVDDIQSEIEDAEQNDEVETIVLDFDTPGGMVTGTPELGDFILDVEKPIFAFTRGQMCSAGYWLASACDGIFATQSSDVGCIGVCASFMDLSRMADMKGIKIKVFNSGAYKGMGQPGTSLSPQQEVFMQNRIMSLAETFYSHVRTQRGAVEDGDMQGQTFKGSDALDNGLIDAVVKDYRDMLSRL